MQAIKDISNVVARKAGGHSKRDKETEKKFNEQKKKAAIEAAHEALAAGEETSSNA